MKPKNLDKSGKKLVESIDKEMNLSRLTESVRAVQEERSALAAKRPK
jgi:hypothetical protein